MSPETASCAFAGDAAGAGGALGAGAVLEIGEGPGAIAGWQAGPSAPSSAASASRMPRRRVVTAAVVIEPIIEPIIENAAPVVKRGPSSGRPAVRYAVSRRSTSTKNRHGQRGPDADRGRGARAVRLWHPAPGRPVCPSLTDYVTRMGAHARGDLREKMLMLPSLQDALAHEQHAAGDHWSGDGKLTLWSSAQVGFRSMGSSSG